MRKRRSKTVKRLIPIILAALAAAALLVLLPKAGRTSTLTPEEAARVLSENEYDIPEREAVVNAAVSLMGKVHYFWGGKYEGIGPDPTWGELKTVTDGGSPNTGKELPWGLDCSGFVTWAFIQAGYSAGEVGHGTWFQWNASEEISLSDIRPGDLVFANEYPGSSSNHVGICIGFYNGRPVAAHCSSTYDNVVVTEVSGAFNYIRRPLIWAEEALDEVDG